jgi:hypothetical protein
MADRQAFISDRDILHNPTLWRRVTIKDSSESGKVYAVKASNGKTISIQPDGSEQDRDGDGGGYERGRLLGDTRLVYAYDESRQPVEFRVILL